MNKKVALVTGAIKGIGKEIGLFLARKGIRVVLTHYDWNESLSDMEKAFNETGTEHLIVKVNLLDTEAIEDLVSEIDERFGRLDILINNIERGGMPVVHGKYIRDQWDLEIETTLRAKRWLFDSSFPLLKKSKDASVINISSIAGIVGRSGPASLLFNEGYATANRGISILTETWARLGSPNVRVNELMLGIFETRHGEKTRGWSLLSDEQKEALIDHTLVKRTGKFEDITKALSFLIFDAPYVTGSVLKIDGGYTLGGEHILPMPEGVV
ncbi:MAG: SDR family oxidoreductase [Deltaproteobacteria bacterium]|nr:SDR family oxidoreductase [Deltaproteobacteria bacterium]